MKINKRILIVSIAISLLPVIAGIFLFDRLPEQIPSHWNAEGIADSYSSRYFVLFNMPIALAILNAVLPFVMKLDPKYENMSDRLVIVVLFVIPVLSNICVFASIAPSLGYDISISRMILIFMGLLFIVIGNYLPKTGQTYTMGIKLPWTLHSEENWNRTHRLGGILWVLSGFLMIVISFLNTSKFMIIALLITLFFAVLIPCIYSYCLYKKGV